MSRRVREALRRGRRDLHREMSVPALYIAVRGAPPHPCTVRPQNLPNANGKPGGSDTGHAQQADRKPSLIFIVDDAPVMIRPGAIVSVEPGEAYRVSFAHPPHDITITVEVTPLPAAEATGLPIPS